MTDLIPRRRPEIIGHRIPATIDVQEFESFCLKLPADEIYQAVFWSHMDKLNYWFSWKHAVKGGAQNFNAKAASDYWYKNIYLPNRATYENRSIASGEFRNPCLNGDCGGDDCPVCADYFPQEESFTFEPYDPRTEYDFTPPPYPSPPFTWGFDVTTKGAIDSDIFVKIPFPPLGSLSTIISNMFNVLKSLLDIDQINNFPRLHFNFTGKGKLQVYFLKVLQGGKALVTIDGKLTSARIFDLQSASLLNPTTYDVLLAQLGISLISGTLIQQTIEEFIIDTDGEHHIDITFLPNVVPPNIGFGGGVRKINLCDMEARAAPPIRNNPDGTVDEWDGGDWNPTPGRPRPISIFGAGDETCECEDDMCNCAYVLKIDPCTGEQYYKDDRGNIHIVTPATSDSVPSLPPVPPDMPETQTNACYKANGVWQVIEDFTDAMIASFSGLSLTPLNSTRKFFTDYGANLKSKNWRVLEFLGNHYTDDPDINEDWEAHKAGLKSAFICAAQDAFAKFPLLTDSDFAWFMAYDFDSPSALLDDFLTDLLEVPENAAWAEAASYHVFAQEGVCDCVGSEPAPDPDALETGCIRLELVRFTPILGNWNIEAETPNSVIASTATPVYGAGTDLPFTNTNNTSTSGDGWQHAVRALMEIAGDEAGWFVRRIEVSFDMSWASGTPQRDYLIAVATAAGSNFDVVASGGDLISNPSLAVNVGLQLSHIFVGIGINTGHNVAGTSRVTNITLYVYPAGYPEDEQIIHFDQNAC